MRATRAFFSTACAAALCACLSDKPGSGPEAISEEAPGSVSDGGTSVHDPEFWDGIAEEYQANAHPFAQRYAEAMLAKLQVGQGVRLLDVAAGTGAASIPAAELGAEVVAIDFSTEMVALLRAQDAPGVEALQMDGQALEFPDDVFDVSVSVFGVMVFPDWIQGLREMARVTKPGGTVAVVTWADPAGAGINQIVAEIGRDLFPTLELPPAPAGMVALSTVEGLSGAMLAAGFQNPSIDTLTESYSFELDDLFRANPWANLLSASQQQAVLEEVRRRFGSTQAGGRLFVETDALLSIATTPPP